MRITRGQVLKAIKKEKLRPGQWVWDHVDPKCEVCAVGAVLRNAGMAPTDIDWSAPRICQYKFVQGDGSIPAQLRRGNYLGALSMKFERLCEMTPMGGRDLWGCVTDEHIETKIKPKLEEWVRDHLPRGVIYTDET
jgi:hypothetical protein